MIQGSDLRIWGLDLMMWVKSWVPTPPNGPFWGIEHPQIISNGRSTMLIWGPDES